MTLQKSRLMFLMELLNRETDEEHPITIAEIIDRLKAEGFSANRHTIAGDLNTLTAHGIDVVRNKSRQNQYFIGDRHFELPELMMLVDAVQAARFVPAKQSKALIAKLSALTSVHQADRLNRQLYVDKHVKSVNEKVLYTVDLLHATIHDGKQVTFQYFEYTVTKKKVLKHGGQVYQFSPYALLWNNDSYSARYFVEEMTLQGFNMVRCIQGAKTLSLPMQMLGADLQAHRVIYNNNPILKWCLTNTGVQTDRNGNIVPIKNQSPRQRIDGAAALLDCYVGLYEHYNEFINAI